MVEVVGVVTRTLPLVLLVVLRSEEDQAEVLEVVLLLPMVP